MDIITLLIEKPALAALAALSAMALAAGAWILLFGGRSSGPGSEAPRPQPLALSEYERIERAAMPEEIAEGQLVISEQTLKRQGDRPFAAKTDQVFRTPLGFLVPVETKTRSRVYASDIVQLSCQAVALKSIGHVLDYGYVRLATPGRKPVYQRVRLLTETEIDRLWDRYQALRTKTAHPIARPKPSRCGRCAFRDGCKSARIA